MTVNVPGLMLDTNVFNRVLDGQLSPASFGDFKIFATHVQLDELLRTKSEIRRTTLAKTFHELAPEEVATETFILGDSRLGAARLSGTESPYEDMLARIVELDRAAKNSSSPDAQSRDVRIAETAIKNGFVLVTGDAPLAQLTQEFGGTAVSIEGVAAVTQSNAIN